MICTYKVPHVPTLWRLSLMCFGGSYCNANVFKKKNAGHTDLGLHDVASAVI